MNHSFEKGTDCMIRVNGEIAGGIYQLKRKTENKAEGIYEFLTDKPVAAIPQVTYILEFSMKSGVNRFFEDTIESIEICGKGRVERYTVCAVKSVESTTLPRGDVTYTVKVSAGERSVLFG